jgi:putative two-component system response regulator
MKNTDTEHKYTILAVDDSEFAIATLTRILRYPYSIITATSGKDAIKKAVEHKPDLILLDVLMPGLTGIETCMMLKKTIETQNIPVVFITSMYDAACDETCLAAGAVDYVRKPYTAGVILKRIENALRSFKGQGISISN